MWAIWACTTQRMSHQLKYLAKSDTSLASRVLGASPPSIREFDKDKTSMQTWTKPMQWPCLLVAFLEDLQARPFSKTQTQKKHCERSAHRRVICGWSLKINSELWTRSSKEYWERTTLSTLSFKLPRTFLNLLKFWTSFNNWPLR